MITGLAGFLTLGSLPPSPEESNPSLPRGSSLFPLPRHLELPRPFERQVLDDQVAIGYGLAIGHVDGDNKPDILLADKTEIVWYRNGDWKRFVMASSLTEHDNVCIAARDINGDGLVEVAVGAQWNPGETSDTSRSGAVFYLKRPADPTQQWEAEQLYHEPTVHRMGWVQTGPQAYQLIVLPLHGRGNRDGKGEGVRVMAYTPPAREDESWKYAIIDRLLHMSHNFEVFREEGRDTETVFIGGKEGVRRLRYDDGNWSASWLLYGHSFGELRIGRNADGEPWLTGIEPMHGDTLTVYPQLGKGMRQVLTTTMRQGHALAAADLLGLGSDQIVAGWRRPNESGSPGIELWSQETDGSWTSRSIDGEGMACEDLKVADLDGDGRQEIIAAGRASHNLVIYWNRSGK